jgi:hypothetical protein
MSATPQTRHPTRSPCGIRSPRSGKTKERKIAPRAGRSRSRNDAERGIDKRQGRVKVEGRGRVRDGIKGRG